MEENNLKAKIFAGKIARGLISIGGALLGTGIVKVVDSIIFAVNNTRLHDNLALSFIVYIASAVIAGIIFFFLAPVIIKTFAKLIAIVESSLSEIPMVDILFGSLGLIVGLIIAYLLSNLIMLIPILGVGKAISAILYIVLGVLGWRVVRKRKGELRAPEFLQRRTKENKEKLKDNKSIHTRPKILDTSVIIDGRIFDICKTGIIEGTLIIPGFVLQELRHISDSSDSLKRNRGRRGLDILNKIQKELDIMVRVEEKDYEDIAEVDAKLIRLAQELGGVVVTNDYNLNKVAAVQEVPVLNINELANAVKPVVLPGEEMLVAIVKDGKEAGQGVAYLDDGTMIVVDGGRAFLGEAKEVVVTSVLQTAAGRMIFAKLK